MRKIFTLLILTLITINIFGQTGTIDSSKVIIEIPQKYFNYEKLLNEETKELNRLVEYFKTFDTLAIDSSTFQANLNSLIGISSRYKTNLNNYKDSIQLKIDDGNISNVDFFKSLNNEITSLNVLVNHLRDSVGFANAENIMKYFIKTKTLESSIDSLNKVIKKKNSYINDTIPELNKVIATKNDLNCRNLQQ